VYKAVGSSWTNIRNDQRAQACIHIDISHYGVFILTSIVFDDTGCISSYYVITTVVKNLREKEDVVCDIIDDD